MRHPGFPDEPQVDARFHQLIAEVYVLAYKYLLLHEAERHPAGALEHFPHSVALQEYAAETAGVNLCRTVGEAVDVD